MPLSTVPFVCLTLAVAAAPVEAPKPPATVQLQYRFTDGETVRYRIDNETTLLALKGETREKTFSRSQTEQRLEVVSIDDAGTATLRLSIERAQMEYAFNDAKPTLLDSRKKNLPAGVAQALGRPLAEVKVRRDGTVEGLQPLLSDAELRAVPGKLGLDGDATSTLFFALPAAPVAVGAEWHDTVNARVTVTERLKQDVKILRQFRLERIEDGMAVIAMRTSVLTPVTEPSMLVQLIQRTSAGTIRFDIAGGRIADWTTNVDNTEIGWHGADSSLRAVSHWSEQLIAEPATVSAR